MNRIWKFMALSLSILASTACAADGSEEEVMLVDHYKQPCMGMAPQLCLRVAQNGSEDLNNFYDSIAGFDYEWGHRYELQVQITEIDNPPADGSSRRYTLLEVISDEVVDDHFTLRLSSEHVVVESQSEKFSLMGDRDITCADVTVCETIDAVLSAHGLVEVELGHSSDPAGPLTAYAARDVSP
jgi:Domain of unknown function (DUF4377)